MDELECPTKENIKYCYDKLIMLYMNELKNMGTPYFKKHYNKLHSNIINMSKSFINKKSYKLNVNFNYACSEYMYMIFKLDDIQTDYEYIICPETARVRLDYIKQYIDNIVNYIFKEVS